MSLTQVIDNTLSNGINEVRRSWGWFLAAGILLILSGAICIVADITATYAMVIVFGWLMLLSGIVGLVQAFQVRNWSGFFLYLLGALARGFAGYMLVRYPLAGAASLTLILASFFIVAGLFRTISSAMLQLPNWGWSVFSGIVSVALGVMLLWQMPISSVWFIGFAVGVDMIVDGTSLVAVSSAIHQLPKLYQPSPKAA